MARRWASASATPSTTSGRADVFGRGQRVEQIESLKYQPQPAAAQQRQFVVREGQNVLPADANAAARRADRARRPDAAACSCPSPRAHHGQKLPDGNIEIDAGQRCDPSWPRAEELCAGREFRRPVTLLLDSTRVLLGPAGYAVSLKRPGEFALPALVPTHYNTTRVASFRGACVKPHPGPGRRDARRSPWGTHPSERTHGDCQDGAQVRARRVLRRGRDESFHQSRPST